MKKIIITITTLLLALASFSQSSAEAKSILDKAYSNFENSKGIKISFSFTAKEGKTIHHQQDGMAMVKGNKFKIEMSNIHTWFDGKTQWVLMDDYDEVNISEPTPEEVASISPTALLSMYKSGFTLDAPTSQTISGKSAFVINMKPTVSGSEFKDISVAIDKQSYTIRQVILTFKNGLTNNINVTEYNTNFNFNDADFVFNKTKHPGVEIIDLR